MQNYDQTDHWSVPRIIGWNVKGVIRKLPKMPISFDYWVSDTRWSVQEMRAHLKTYTCHFQVAIKYDKHKKYASLLSVDTHFKITYIWCISKCLYIYVWHMCVCVYAPPASLSCTRGICLSVCGPLKSRLTGSDPERIKKMWKRFPREDKQKRSPGFLSTFLCPPWV